MLYTNGNFKSDLNALNIVYLMIRLSNEVEVVAL